MQLTRIKDTIKLLKIKIFLRTIKNKPQNTQASTNQNNQFRDTSKIQLIHFSINNFKMFLHQIIKVQIAQLDNHYQKTQMITINMLENNKQILFMRHRYSTR